MKKAFALSGVSNDWFTGAMLDRCSAMRVKGRRLFQPPNNWLTSGAIAFSSKSPTTASSP